MSINLLETYESRINGKNVKLVRNEEGYSRGRLYINNKCVGLVPFVYTINRMIALEDKCYPVYEYKTLKPIN